MNAISFDYSLKNIPLPSKTSNIKTLVEKVESLLRRMRWKVYFFELNQEDEDHASENFGLKSDLTPPKNESISLFEKDMYQLIKSIEFEKSSNEFMLQMSEDLKSLQNTNQVIVFADKTTNLYKMDVDNYHKLLRENITKKYKKAPANATDEINQDAKSVAAPLQHK